MRVPLACLLVLVVALIPATPGLAAPVLRYTWGPADGLIVNQDFAGPATYSQTLSVTGLSGAVSHFTIMITHAPYWGPGSAWHAIMPPNNSQVSAPTTDCEGGPGFSVATAVAGADAIPNATASVLIGCHEGVTNHAVTCALSIEVTINPPFAANPATRYGIATLEYHHQNSVVGISPDACDGAERTMCWLTGGFGVPYAIVNGLPVGLSSEGGLLSWQNTSGDVDCWRAATPTHSSTWGSIKTLYR